MTNYVSTFIPNTEESLIYDNFDYLFGCEYSDEYNLCKIDENKSCPITTQ